MTVKELIAQLSALDESIQNEPVLILWPILDDHELHEVNELVDYGHYCGDSSPGILLHPGE